MNGNSFVHRPEALWGFGAKAGRGRSNRVTFHSRFATSREHLRTSIGHSNTPIHPWRRELDPLGRRAQDNQPYRINRWAKEKRGLPTIPPRKNRWMLQARAWIPLTRFQCRVWMRLQNLLTHQLCPQRQLRRLEVLINQTSDHPPGGSRGALDPSLTCTVLSPLFSTGRIIWKLHGNAW